ncbi:hypothetical protein [Haloferula sp. BvORR071]|uniref:hypothetical protein n=1 Tax=Haloferula sp. BvORR071 TaxID=1396141 RepID=UPI002240F611|nr:hypothetical protein [Haloferula sp. BvORR071]
MGYYPIGQSGCWVKVFEDKNGEINVETRLKPLSETQHPGAVTDLKSVEGYIDPKEPWCVYIQDESTIWIFHSTGAEKHFCGTGADGRLGLDRDALLGGKLHGVPAEFLAGIEKVRGASQQDPENATE